MHDAWSPLALLVQARKQRSADLRKLFFIPFTPQVLCYQLRTIPETNKTRSQVDGECVSFQNARRKTLQCRDNRGKDGLKVPTNKSTIVAVLQVKKEESFCMRSAFGLLGAIPSPASLF
ncbi:hypothetical protein COEREDRAFT_103100 [Coemansia reversa NRRL 1564]|uniref:Uncharacterized protein n=1 Tax=Coemansia reversa (strain ATCC 12441 / NRRL 1564) TaxID=763665 RepID=A0A2G5B7Q7_COERN|nr:hypothetical protein COEREDRAFT_103100 [Coemansia reversa NRRL 1564]|eukprot:PIA15039.1 hypothetical protein COEREDRAFT_103100 [Coemansia reversa NRRL 1564]